MLMYLLRIGIYFSASGARVMLTPDEPPCFNKLRLSANRRMSLPHESHTRVQNRLPKLIKFMRYDVVTRRQLECIPSVCERNTEISCRDENHVRTRVRKNFSQMQGIAIILTKMCVLHESRCNVTAQ